MIDQSSAKDFYHIVLPVRDRQSETKGAETTMRFPMILPHELLHYLSDSRHSIWYNCFTPCRAPVHTGQ